MTRLNSENIEIFTKIKSKSLAKVELEKLFKMIPDSHRFAINSMTEIRDEILAWVFA